MKKLKQGFSLAELLIAVLIISIIATLGFKISQQGVENAYNQYIYTGYKGLYDALSEATHNGKSIIYRPKTVSFSLDIYQHILNNKSCEEETLREPRTIILPDAQTIVVTYYQYQRNNHRTDCRILGIVPPGEEYIITPWSDTFRHGNMRANYGVDENGNSVLDTYGAINKEFIDEIANLLNIKNENITIESESNGIISGTVTLRAPNGIVYRISKNQNYNINGHHPISAFYNPVPIEGGNYRVSNFSDTSLYESYFITMDIPGVKRNNTAKTVAFLYVPELNGGMLIPIDPSNWTNNRNIINLQNRKDLLPFYIDDGKVGKIIVPINGDKPQLTQRRRFYSFREAYCKQHHNDNLNIPIDEERKNIPQWPVIDCNGVSAPAADENIQGNIKAENPKKVF